MQARALPPGPPKVARWSLAHLRNLRNYIRDPLALVAGRFASYGELYLAQTGGEMLYVIKHPDDLKTVLVDQADAFRKAEIGLEKLLGQSLLTANGSLWKQRRRMIQPGFHKERIEAYGEVMVEEARRTAEGWKAGQSFDAAEEMTRLTLRIVARTLFSHRVADEADRVAGTMAIAQQVFGTFDVLPEWLPTPGHRRARKAIADFNGLIYEMIDAREQARARGETHQDLLEMLLDAVDPDAEGDERLDREGLRDELVTLYMAGHETTANGLAWAWYLLSHNPEVERRLVEELRAVVGDAPISVDDLERLPYLRAVVHEVLRMFPPAYVVARSARREVVVRDWTLPKGAVVTAWIYMTHHDPRWYPNPDRFDPERFLGDAEQSRPRHAFLPFGAGARMCIGRGFALMEMQLVLGTILQRWGLSLSTERPILPRPRITLTPKGGVPVVVRAR